MSTWTVREASAADAAAVVALLQQFSLEQNGRPSPLTAHEVQALAFGEQPRFSITVAELGDEVIAYALYYNSYDTDHAARGLYLQDLYVAPQARRRGIGRALMSAVARACRDDGGRYLVWNAAESNRAARAFYRALGAREEPVVTLSLQPEALRRLAHG